MGQVLRFNGTVKRDPAIEAWMGGHPGELGQAARHWFELMRACGEDVREVLHDGHPTACLGDAAFGYVNVFKDHLNVGFFRGAELADPKGLLEGTGKYMRHVKVRAGGLINAPALTRLITAAYADMSKRLQAGEEEQSERRNVTECRQRRSFSSRRVRARPRRRQAKRPPT